MLRKTTGLDGYFSGAGRPGWPAVGVELDSAFADAARDLWADAGLEVVRGDFTRVVANGSCPPRPTSSWRIPRMSAIITWTARTRDACNALRSR
jgi:hypothetical protein